MTFNGIGLVIIPASEGKLPRAAPGQHFDRTREIMANAGIRAQFSAGEMTANSLKELNAAGERIHRYQAIDNITFHDTTYQ